MKQPHGDERYRAVPVSSLGGGSGQSVLMPLLPLELWVPEGQSIRAHGLLDTGATINVLPFTLGLRAGGVWERQNRMIPLAGNLANQEARANLANTLNLVLEHHRDEVRGRSVDGTLREPLHLVAS